MNNTIIQKEAVAIKEHIEVILQQLAQSTKDNQPLSGKTIFVRGGHGGKDPGCVYGGVMEKTINYLNRDELIPMLKAAGAIVYSDGGPDDDDNLLEIAKYANSLNVDMVLDLHGNAFHKLEANGTLCFYYRNSENGKRLADLIQKSIVEATGIKKNYNQGVNDIMVSRTKAVAVIIEYGFVSNANDRKLLLNPEWRTKANIAIVEAVIEYLIN